MEVEPDPYYRRDLALVHHRGFGFHADLCASGILDLLQPVRDRGGAVLELGCGSGLLTRYLLEAGHRVIATDVSSAMLDLAREVASGADIRELVLSDDPLLLGHLRAGYYDRGRELVPARDALIRDLRAVIDDEYGGAVTRPLVIALTMARRQDP